jgi:hypothetical protein
MSGHLMESENLRELFQLIDEEKHNKRLGKLLSETVKSTYYVGDTFSISFHNGVTVSLIFNNIDDLSMTISDPKFYRNDDTDLSYVSHDRLYFYLKLIAEYNRHAYESDGMS